MGKIAVVYLVWNVIVMAIYGIDKELAKADAWRISENTLFSLAVAFGAVGAWLGMRIFRHKTKHAKFVYTVPLLALCNLAVIYFVMQRVDI